MLLGCGTVVATENGKSLVRFAREYCAGCPGSCRLIANRDIELWLDEQLNVSTDVEVATASSSLTLGVAVTLGLPLVCAFVVFYAFQSWLFAFLALALGILGAVGYCRSRSFGVLMRPRVRVLR